MLHEVLILIPALLIAMLMNTLTGTYQKIGIEHIVFDKTIFFNGLIKLAIVFVSLVGLAYLCDTVAFLTLEETPLDMLKAAITFFGAKAGVNLYKILKGSVSERTSENGAD